MPSRGLKPIRMDHFCHCTFQPSTVKLGPSGWVISIGLTSVAELGERRTVVLVEHELRGVVPRGRRQRDHAVVLDVDDLHGVQVERDDQALDRPRISVLGRGGSHERQRPADQRRVVVVVLRAVIACGPGIDHGEIEVRDTALAHRLLPPRILANNLLDTGEVLDQVGREPARHRGPRIDDPCAEVDEHLLDHLRPDVVHRDERPPRHVRRPLKRQRRRLVRLRKLNHHEFHCGRAVFGVRDDRPPRLDLGRRSAGPVGTVRSPVCSVRMECGAVHRHGFTPPSSLQISSGQAPPDAPARLPG